MKVILRNLVYSKPETYSEHHQTSTMELFTKMAQKEKVLIFSYISGNKTF